MANNFSGVVNQTGGLIKRFYADTIVDQFNEDMPIYKMSEKVKESGQGDAVYIPLRLRRNQGIGAGVDGGLLPAIGRQTVIQAKLDWKFNWMRAGLTSGLIAASKSNVGAFVKGIDLEIRMGYKDFANDFNRQLSYDGTGALASLSANAVGTTTFTAIGREGTNEDGNKFLDVGMIVDIVSTTGVVKASGLTITAMSGTSTATVTVDQAINASSTDLVVRTGNYNNEVQGLLYALDGGTTTLYTNIDRSLYPIYQGNVLNLGGAQLTLDNMQNAYNEGLRRGGTGNGSYQLTLMDFASSRMYQKLLVADKRYVNTVKLDGGGWEKTQIALEYNGVPVKPDKDFPVRIMFCPPEVLKYYVLSEMEIADEWGSNLFPSSDNDIYEIRFRMFGNLFNSQPAAFGVLRNYISP